MIIAKVKRLLRRLLNKLSGILRLSLSSKILSVQVSSRAFKMFNRETKIVNRKTLKIRVLATASTNLQCLKKSSFKNCLKAALPT
ncbi:hypothetical protein WN51_01594 [Melipona quadrifasciata]|uniref:Uncharacterized protein n=1 Tax=Melipona quadrifasciata TaxID=166423 RepID=A0A0N1ITB8_9HYME|nr:hypothetical protein WN51_01594 [Melipona quadrifasciata]